MGVFVCDVYFRLSSCVPVVLFIIVVFVGEFLMSIVVVMVMGVRAREVD